MPNKFVASDKDKTFTIECTMKERCIPAFMSFLHQLQFNGNVGHSSSIAFYADGDGDFRPKFRTDEPYYIINPSIGAESKKAPEFLYDAR